MHLLNTVHAYACASKMGVLSTLDTYLHPTVHSCTEKFAVMKSERHTHPKPSELTFFRCIGVNSTSVQIDTITNADISLQAECCCEEEGTPGQASPLGQGRAGKNLLLSQNRLQ